MNTTFKRLKAIWWILRGWPLLSNMKIVIEKDEIRFSGNNNGSIRAIDTVFIIDGYVVPAGDLILRKGESSTHHRPYASPNLPSDNNERPATDTRPGEVRPVQTPPKRGRGRPRKTPPTDKVG